MSDLEEYKTLFEKTKVRFREDVRDEEETLLIIQSREGNNCVNAGLFCFESVLEFHKGQLIRFGIWE